MRHWEERSPSSPTYIFLDKTESNALCVKVIVTVHGTMCNSRVLDVDEICGPVVYVIVKVWSSYCLLYTSTVNNDNFRTIKTKVFFSPYMSLESLFRTPTLLWTIYGQYIA